MANNNDVDKILQNIKSKNPPAKPAGTVSSDRLSQIIAQETARAKAEPAAKSDVAVTAKTVTPQKSQQNTAHEIENEFFSQLATALKENPAVADLVEEVPKDFDVDEKNKVSVTAASYVDEKFVDFFTQSIAVPKPEPKSKTSEIVVKRRKFGLFKNKYITDSLSLSIPQEEIDRRQQKVAKPAAKPTTQELAKDFISKAAREVKPFTDEIPVQNNAPKAAEKEDVKIFSKTEKPAKETAKQGDTKEIVAEKPAEKKEYLPEATNDTVILYYDDGKPAPEKAAPKQSGPMDADSILKSLKSRKTVTTKSAVETEQAKAETAAKKTELAGRMPDMADILARNSDAAAESAVSEAAPLEDTAYMPRFETAEDGSIKAVEEDSTVKEITGDITQLFAKAGVEEKAPEAVQIIDEDDENGEEEVFEEFIDDEEDYIVGQFSDDPAEILDELKNFKLTLTMRVALSGIASLVLLYLSLAASKGLPLPGFISPVAQPLMFYLANLIFFALVLIGFLPTVANGITGFFRTPTQDSFMVVPALLCFVQINAAIFNHSSVNPEAITIFASVAALAFGFNALGKYINANTILRNLSLAEVPEGINAGYVIKDFEDVKRLARSLEEKNPQILVSRRTGYISNFISGGFSHHYSEKLCRILSLAAAVVSIACGVIAFVNTKDFLKAVSAATAASVFTLPLSHSLISSVPSSMMQKALNKVGALVNGWQGIYQLSETSHVSFDAKHLFPKGCVVLHGIKTFEKERLDLAILYAASIAIEKCDNLRPVFLNVIDNKMDMLYPLESCEYKVGQGYVAWIENNRVIMGNRSIMQEYNIALPPLSMETQYISENKKPVYLSVNGKLFGMFVVSYHADMAVKDNLLHLVEQGKCVILQSNDFSIDNSLLEAVYDLPKDTVQVLNKNETALLLNYTAYAENTDSAMAHLDSLHSLSAGFFGADSAKRAAATCSLVQIISIIAGAALSFMFTFSQTIWGTPVTSILLLSFGWLGLCLMRAVATKYL